MIVSLIGMSGTGKSHWSEKLVSYGFQRFCCDDLIEKKLNLVLREKGFSGIQEVARWMGQPYDSHYAEASQEYLRLEIETMQQLLRRLEHTSVRDNIVLDTTGSIIYVPEIIITQLRKLTTIVYLETPESVQQQMFKRYIEDPKPVYWGTIFHKTTGETNIEALKKCYPQLLHYRSAQYAAIADLVIEHTVHSQPTFTPEDMMTMIHNYQQNNTCFY